MEKKSKIYIAGHRGMVGSAILKCLQENGYTNLVAKSSVELDLRDQSAVRRFFEQEKLEFVFLAAAKVGGIQANTDFPAEFIFDNISIQNNVIHESYRTGVKKLMFLGSSCIYPKFAPQPMNEDSLLTGKLEPTNEAYAIAKIAGLKMCDAYRKQYGCNFISVMPTNLYGPNDNFDLARAHVIPALLRKFHDAVKTNASEVEVWGTGNALREFMHVNDLANACLFLMEHFNDGGFINAGTGTDISIRNLANLVAEITGFEGKIIYNSSKPDGTPRKLMDTSRLNGLGWKPAIELRAGLEEVYTSVKNKL